MGISGHDAGLPTRLQIELTREPACASTARRIVREAVGDQLGELALERVMLAVSELVTNACRHGRGAIELRLARLPESLRVEVTDQGSDAVPRIREQPGDQSGGWGLRIVDELALRWGCAGDTTRVWAELPLH